MGFGELLARGCGFFQYYCCCGCCCPKAGHAIDGVGPAEVIKERGPGALISHPAQPVSAAENLVTRQPVMFPANRPAEETRPEAPVARIPKKGDL